MHCANNKVAIVRDLTQAQQRLGQCQPDALRKQQGGNCSRSYASLAKVRTMSTPFVYSNSSNLFLPNETPQATGDWCNRSTIINWLQSKPDYCMYTKRIRPGLTEANREKQITFSKHVHNRWGLLPNTKVLWTMSDEKWWFGLVSRTFAKM